MQTGNTFAYVLIALGVLFLLANLGILPIHWGIIWPAILIAIGVAMILRRNRI